MRSGPPNFATDKIAKSAGGSLSDRIYEAIYEKITEGEWPVGTRLPTEIQLAARFSVSRPIVREALLRLRIDGVVESRQKAGTRVISVPSRVVLEFAQPGSIADLQRCYEFRVGIEGEAAYLAANLRSTKRIAEIEQAHKKLVAAHLDPNELGADEDIDFHRAIARATENSYFISTIESVTQAITVAMQVARTLSRAPTQQRLSKAVQEHKQIILAIQIGDGDLARALMRKHIEAARSRVFLGRAAE